MQAYGKLLWGGQGRREGRGREKDKVPMQRKGKGEEEEEERKKPKCPGYIASGGRAAQPLDWKVQGWGWTMLGRD
jgi:hypothetical protein